MVRRQSHTNMNFMKSLSRNITRRVSWSALFSNHHPELFTSLQRKRDSTRTTACSVSQNQNTITELWRCYHLDSSQDVITQEDLAQGRRLIKCSRRSGAGKNRAPFKVFKVTGDDSHPSLLTENTSPHLLCCILWGFFFSAPRKTSGASHSTTGSWEQLLMEHVNVLWDPARTAAISSITYLAGEQQCANPSRILL